MDLCDYRQQLGLSFNDSEKEKLFVNSVLNFLKCYMDTSSEFYYFHCVDYINFCNSIGCSADTSSLFTLDCNQYIRSGFNSVFIELKKRQLNIKEFLFAFIVFINSIKCSEPYIKRTDIYDILKLSLDTSKIQYDIVEDEDGYFVYPKGAEELDNRLIAEPLVWLKDYPRTRKIFSTALKQYDDCYNASDVSDNLRKTIETFFQEYLGNDKNLENNKVIMFSSMKLNGADDILMNLFSQVLSSYSKYNNETAKHHIEKVNPLLLEFLLYQTGLLLRTVIVLKSSKQ